MSARRSEQFAAPVDDLTAAHAILGRFTQSGVVSRAVDLKPRHRVDFNDRFAVAALELHGQMATDPSHSSAAGAWLARLQSRAAGHCSPLHGVGEGLYVLVLDAQAVAELQDAAAEHRAAVEKFAQLQADLAELAGWRGRGQS